MEGTRLKKLMKYYGISNNDMADKLGMTPQNLSFLLSREDIRTGLLEQMCEIMGINPADLYGGASTATASNNSTAIAGNDNKVGDCGLLEKAMNENAVLLEQNSRLLSIIENLSNK